MTNATVDETVSATQDTPVSDDEPTLLSDASGEEGASVVEEQATQGEEHSEDTTTVTTTVTTTPEERHKELQSKIDAFNKGDGDPLSTDEKEEFRRLEQSANDRRQAEAQRREKARQANEQLQEKRGQFAGRVHERITGELTKAQEEGRGVSRELLTHGVNQEIEALLKDVKPLVLVDLDQNIEAAFFAMGDDAESREVWDAATTHEARLNLYTERYAQARIAESTDAKKITRLEKQNADLQAEINKLTGERGANGSGASTNGTRGSAGASYSTKEEARTLHAQGKISNTEMRRVNADPTIPEGY